MTKFFPNSSSNLNTYKEPSRLISPRFLAILLLLAGFAVTVILFYPISEVFKGHWKLNQKVDLIQNARIDFTKIGLGSLGKSLFKEEVLLIGTISIRFYAVMILLGLLSGYVLVLYLSKFQYIAGTIIDRLVIGLIVSGLIGARLVFALFNWDIYVDQPLSIITETMNGGLSFFGMLIFTLAYLGFYCARFKFNIYEFLDFLAPGMLLGQAIGRFGNFFNYESYGPETSVFWKMFVPETANFYGADLNVRYFHPTFLYEIIPNFLLLIFLLFNYNKLTEKKAGLVFALYAMGYGLIRFITEIFRLDALRINLPQALQFDVGEFFTVEYLLVSQIAAVLLFFAGLWIFLYRSKVLYFKKNMNEFDIS